MTTPNAAESIDASGSKHPAMRALLHEIVDYAGLFPPAGLDMKTVVRNYANYVEHAESWMLSRLIVPTKRLDEFEQEAVDLLPTDENVDPWPISALTAPAGDDQLKSDLERINVFNERHSNSDASAAVVDVIELRATESAAIDVALDMVDDAIYPFFEINHAEDPRGLLASLAGSDAGAKIRTGGVTADLYPTPKHLARFIAACATANVPFKATAGLHHPMRQYSDAVHTDEFGFLNVFLAAGFAYFRDFDEQRLTDVLCTEDPALLVFNQQGVVWQEHELTLDELEDLRLTFAISFGSCSFDEPRDDLRAMNLL